MGAARSIVRTVATVALIAVAAPVVGAALVGGAVSAGVATAVGAGVISGGITALQGGKASDILKSAVIGGIVSGVGASVSASVSSSIADAAREAGFTSIADTMGKVVGGAAGSASSSAISAAARGKDPIDALLTSGISGLLTGGAGATVSSYTADIPGFSDLSKDYGAAGSAIQRAVNTGLTAGLLGKDVESSTLNSIIGSVSRTAGDYLKDGVKDLSDSVRTAYTTLTDSGNAVDKNLADQKAAADSYNKLSAELTKNYNDTNDVIAKYKDAKDGFENYDAKMQRDGYQASADEDGTTTYFKRVGGKYEDRSDGEGGTYRAFVPDGSVKDEEGNPTIRTIYAPTKDQFLNDANKYAAIANEQIKTYNDTYNGKVAELDKYKSTLTTLQADQSKLESAFIDNKKTMDTTLADYTAQEKANADYISKTINDVATARSLVKDQLGADLNDDQIAAFVKTGDVGSAAKDYIDLKTTDLGEAQAAALQEGYYFDPNDPELAKQFLGVKDEKDTLDALQKFADARATTVQEATDLYKQTYADIYGSDVDVPDPTAEDLLNFMPSIPTDVAGIPKGYQGVAEDVVKGRIQDQFSQNLGFDDYADRTAAQETLGEARPDAAVWQDYGKTGGVKDTGSSVYFAGPKPGTDITSPWSTTSADQNVAEFAGPTLEDLGITPTSTQTAQTQDQTPASTQFGFDQIASSDTTGTPSAEDLSITGKELPTDLAQGNADFDQQVAGFNPQDYMLGTQNKLDTTAPGVQTASLGPTTTMTDTGAPTDIGLRSLLTQQEGGTSAESAKSGIGTLTEKSLAEDTTQQDQTQGADTNIADSTLTTGAPAGTITSQVLGENADQDVPAGTLTSKYFNDEKKGADNADSLTGKSPASEFTYSSPRPTDDILRDTSTGADKDQLDSFLSPLRTQATTLTTSQDTPQTNAATQLGTNTQGNNMDDEFDAISQEDADMGRAMTQNAGGVDESFLNRLSPEELDRYNRMQAGEDTAIQGLTNQDLGISQQSIDEFNNTFNPAGGFGSQWQTVGSDRIMVNDDGTGIGINTETGEQYALTPAQVQSLINNGMLNTAGSGYVAATGGTGTKPGGTGGTGGTKTTGGTGSKVVDKVIDKLTNYATSDRGLAAIAGALAGPAIAPKGIKPSGLRGIQSGSGKQLVQTGAKGTGGKGGVRYFEKKAGGGQVGGLGYLKTAHDGMADQINATIDNKRPAKLSGGEFVIPADVVSHLGNGNSEAGAKQLYDLMSRIRKARTGTSDQGKQINPKKYLPK